MGRREGNKRRRGGTRVRRGKGERQGGVKKRKGEE